jgi:hypothetical protein
VRELLATQPQSVSREALLLIDKHVELLRPLDTDAAVRSELKRGDRFWPETSEPDQLHEIVIHIERTLLAASMAILDRRRAEGAYVAHAGGDGDDAAW